MRSFMAKVFGTQSPHDKVVEIFRRYGHSGKVLDAPAGTGIISQRLRDTGFEVWAADINPHLFCLRGVTCRRADLNQNLPFEDNCFDFVLCSNGIEHLEDPFHFVRECYRILKEKGKLLITTPNILSLKSRLANLLVGFNLFTGRPCNEVDDFAGGDHIHLTDYYELRVNIHRNGFRILEAATHQFSHTAMFLFPLVPFIYLSTYRAFRRERNRRQWEKNKEIFEHVLSPDLLFGKKLFLVSEKNPLYVRNDGRGDV